VKEARTRRNWVKMYHNLPITIEGIAAEKHPNAAMKERVLATLTSLAERTRWKYACHGIPPNISMMA